MSEPTAPRVRFLLGGVQKGGTTALAHCLSQHPQVLLPFNKEAHVFDAPDFDDTWRAAQIDERYASHFPAQAAVRWVGDATPIYCLHEHFVQRIARYNPQMRWLLLLRDPVERAISQYHMERGRGDETWPLLPALCLERWRLRGHLNNFSADSPLRRHSYRLRGDYARQLDTLYRHFDASQVLVLRSDEFQSAPREVLQRVYRHLDLSMPVRVPARTQVFAGNYTPPSQRSLTRLTARWLLRRELQAMRAAHGLAFN